MSLAPTVRGTSIRVALVATGVVGLAYLAIAVAVVMIVTANLTSQIDDDLTRALVGIVRGPAPNGGGPFEAPPPDRPFGPVTLLWTVAGDGAVDSSRADAPLPADARDTTSARTITIGDTQVRIEGVSVGPTHVVVGKTMEAVSQAQSTIVLAEVAIAPALLLIVFLGAVAIGRRVAAPIELARRRQMEFTADASHELRTPLSVIEAHTSLALSQERTADWYRTAFSRIDTESRRMRRLLDDLLWLARFDAAHDVPSTEPVDLGLIAAQATDRFGIVAETRHLTLSMVSGATPSVVAAPPDWLDRLLAVLIDNACRYSPEGGSVTVSVATDAGRPGLTVDDSGPGIPPDERQRIFDRFHRASDTPGGAGLGLAIADAIVRATNGRWRIGTSPAGGASMSVSWPQRSG